MSWCSPQVGIDVALLDGVMRTDGTLGHKLLIMLGMASMSLCTEPAGTHNSGVYRKVGDTGQDEACSHALRVHATLATSIPQQLLSRK